jgi:hypothetical protein
MCGPWHQGACFDLPISFVLNLYKKSQGGFNPRPELLPINTRKKKSGPPSPQWGFDDPALYTKT